MRVDPRVMRTSHGQQINTISIEINAANDFDTVPLRQVVFPGRYALKGNFFRLLHSSLGKSGGYQLGNLLSVQYHPRLKIEVLQHKGSIELAGKKNTEKLHRFVFLKRDSATQVFPFLNSLGWSAWHVNSKLAIFRFDLLPTGSGNALETTTTDQQRREC